MGKRKNVMGMVSETREEKIFKSKDIANLREDLSVYPLLPHLGTSTETNKDKSKDFGEVFTPLWLVDEMIQQTQVDATTHTLDLCAGYGQFSIRLLRKLYSQDPLFDQVAFLKHNHSFSELQLSSCHKIIRVFGLNINLFIGDSKELPSLPEVARGIWVYLESMKGWIPITHTVREMIFIGDTKKITSEALFSRQLQKLIDKLNKGYSKMKEAALNIKFSPDMRLQALKLLDNDLHDLTNDETVHTPSNVVKDLLSNVAEQDARKILVLFNGEIVEQLVHDKKVKRENILFGVQEAKIARAAFISKMYGVDIFTFGKITPKSILEALGAKKYDLGLSNPPWNDQLSLKIMTALINAEVAKEWVTVDSSVWLLDKKDKKNAIVAYKNAIEGKIKSLKLWNGNTDFGIGQYYPCIITHIVEGYDGTISADYFGKKFTMSSITEEVRYGDNWNTIVSPFYNTIKQYIAQYSSIWDKNLKQITPGKYYAQFGSVRGTAVREVDDPKMVKDDFFTIARKDSDKNKSITKAMDDRPGPTFQFDSEVERDNFVESLKTDFVRFCLSLLKISQNIYYGEMGMIPWMNDYTQAWDDERFFTHFNIDQQTQNYIRSFLPDYYHIRNRPAVLTSTSITANAAAE